MPGSPSPQRRSPSLEGETTVRDADKGLDQDELVKQVMEELRAQGTTGGGKPASTEEVVDIKIDAATHIRPAPQIERTGRDYGLKVQQKLEEEKRRTLRVGGLSVKLPSAKTGEHARGTLTAKIRRVSQKLSSTPAETLSAKMQRIAVFMDHGGDDTPTKGGRKKRRHTKSVRTERPPFRRRRHLSAN